VKKLLGIMAVVALFAVPVMAADIPVTITVAPYCAILTAPGPLIMSVTDPLASAIVGVGLHQAETTFTVQGNKVFTATLTAQYTSNSAMDVPGGTEPTYPTAYTGGAPLTPPTNGIGFGPGFPSLSNGGTATGWNGITLKDVLSLNAGVTNGTLRINTYLDSGRSGVPGAGGGQLAPPGSYTCNLYLTLAIAP
jgi:hypothetical protein